LKENSVIQDDWHLFKFRENENINLELIKNTVEKIKKLNLQNLSLEQLDFLYQNSDSIPDWITCCQNINKLSVNKEDMDKLENTFCCHR